MCCLFFFKQKTAYEMRISDWSSDVCSSDLTNIIRAVHNTLVDIDGGVESTGPDLTPAVPIKKSVNAEFIVCLEDGKKLKMLKRYLRSQYGMTPEEYRARWGLPADYPMVAPNYAAQRSRLAKQIGLGRPASSAPRSQRRQSPAIRT